MAMLDETGLSRLLADGVQLNLIEPHIFSVYQDTGEARLYDRMANFYDSVICNRVYNRMVWGYSVGSYDSLVQNALASAEKGWVLDAGCGSLAFTAKTYLGCSGRPMILLDKSLNLLKIAKERLVRLKGIVPENVIFLQGDALQLPFKPQCFETIVSMNLLHVIPDLERVLLRIKNVLKDNGTITFTTLIKSSRFFANRYLNFMGSLGEVVPRDISQLLAVFEKLGMPVQHNVVGNMAFIHYG